MTARPAIDDLVDALDFLADGEFGQAAMLDRHSGQVLLISDEVDFEEMNGIPEPDDLYDSERYVEMPTTSELDLGARLAQSFAREQLPAESENVATIFSKRGAYGRFKDLLEQRGMLEDWYRYEAEARATAMREWAESMDIAIAESN